MMSVNSKVVCVDDRFPNWVHQVYLQLPKKDSVYTVRAVCMRRETLKGSDAVTVALLLHELKNPPDPSHKDHNELAFKEERFRPLEELKDDEHKEDALPDVIGTEVERELVVTT